MRVPKESPRKLLKSVGGEGAGDIPATDVARIRAFRDFPVRTKLMIDCGGGKWRTDEIAVETHIVILAMMYLAGFSDFLAFRLTCVGPASADICAGSA